MQAVKETEEEGWREDEFEVADTGSRLPLASKLSETRPSLASYGRLCYVQHYPPTLARLFCQRQVLIGRAFRSTY